MFPKWSSPSLPVSLGSCSGIQPSLKRRRVEPCIRRKDTEGERSFPFCLVPDKETFQLASSSRDTCVGAVSMVKLDYWGSRGCIRQEESSAKKLPGRSSDPAKRQSTFFNCSHSNDQISSIEHRDNFVHIPESYLQDCIREEQEILEAKATCNPFHGNRLAVVKGSDGKSFVFHTATTNDGVACVEAFDIDVRMKNIQTRKRSRAVGKEDHDVSYIFKTKDTVRQVVGVTTNPGDKQSVITRDKFSSSILQLSSMDDGAVTTTTNATRDDDVISLQLEEVQRIVLGSEIAHVCTSPVLPYESTIVTADGRAVVWKCDSTRSSTTVYRDLCGAHKYHSQGGENCHTLYGLDFGGWRRCIYATNPCELWASCPLDGIRTIDLRVSPNSSQPETVGWGPYLGCGCKKIYDNETGLIKEDFSSSSSSQRKRWMNGNSMMITAMESLGHERPFQLLVTASEPIFTRRDYTHSLEWNRFHFMDNRHNDEFYQNLYSDNGNRPVLSYPKYWGHCGWGDTEVMLYDSRNTRAPLVRWKLATRVEGTMAINNLYGTESNTSGCGRGGVLECPSPLQAVVCEHFVDDRNVDSTIACVCSFSNGQGDIIAVQSSNFNASSSSSSAQEMEDSCFNALVKASAAMDHNSNVSDSRGMKEDANHLITKFSDYIFHNCDKANPPRALDLPRKINNSAKFLPVDGKIACTGLSFYSNGKNKNIIWLTETGKVFSRALRLGKPEEVDGTSNSEENSIRKIEQQISSKSKLTSGLEKLNRSFENHDSDSNRDSDVDNNVNQLSMKNQFQRTESRVLLILKRYGIGSISLSKLCEKEKSIDKKFLKNVCEMFLSTRKSNKKEKIQWRLLRDQKKMKLQLPCHQSKRKCDWEALHTCGSPLCRTLFSQSVVCWLDDVDNGDRRRRRDCRRSIIESTSDSDSDNSHFLPSRYVRPADSISASVILSEQMSHWPSSSDESGE
eukprot:g1483.t1